MSCLVFDIGIEPLAAALRKSKLKGIQIPGLKERLVSKLFADDTTAYLCEEDDYKDLDEVTSRWCLASRAKFNAEKTELIPIGGPQFRKKVIETRRLKDEGQVIPEQVNIVRDGAQIRCLGAWIGNGTKNTEPWLPVIETIERNLERWGRKRLSLNGKKLAVGMEVGGRTQFLTAAQTMPKEIEEKLVKIITGFMWDGRKTPSIAYRTLCAPISCG
ncbi:hypothetical protein C8Q78DRAFT_1071862 [Trametes maxima]|nr:hypothetical protein C8Q78DRAFT_1071862 [Trametes maxima]